MTDRDRLIEIIRQGKDMTPCAKDNDYRCEGIKCADCESESIADHLLANGVIVPPCKVGDKVWWLTTANWQQTEWKIVEVKVSAIQQKADKSWKIRITHNSSVWEFKVEDIGTRYFLTKEEAEKKIKKG